MFIYEKKLQYPVNIKKKDLKMAKYLMSQYGGPDSELSAALQYMNQRYSMPDSKGKALLTDIATEELGHLEMIATMIYQLMENATIEEIKSNGLGGNFAIHDGTFFLSDPNGVPYTTSYISTTGDHITDLESDMAAEQRARSTYEHLMDLTDYVEVLKPFKELRNYYLKNQIN